MKQQIFFLHSGGPQGLHEGSDDFVRWLDTQLGAQYEIVHPIMPHPEAPDYEAWRAALRKEFAKLHDDVILVGHSLGGSFLLKYLSEEKIDISISTLLLIAVPFWGGDKTWMHEPFNLHKDFSRSLPKISSTILYHSKDDPIVSVTHLAMYAAKIPRSVPHILQGNNHAFSEGLPQVVKDLRN